MSYNCKNTSEVTTPFNSLKAEVKLKKQSRNKRSFPHKNRFAVNGTMIHTRKSPPLEKTCTKLEAALSAKNNKNILKHLLVIKFSLQRVTANLKKIFNPAKKEKQLVKSLNLAFTSLSYI